MQGPQTVNTQGVIEQIQRILAKADQLWKANQSFQAFQEIEKAEDRLDMANAPCGNEGSINNFSMSSSSKENKFKGKYGLLCYRIGRYKQALNIFLQLQKKVKNSCRIYKIIGDCYRKTYRFDAAMQKYVKGLKLYGKNPESIPLRDKAALLVSKGLLLAVQGKKPQAVICYDEAIEATPNNPILHCHMGNMHYSMEQEEQAKQNYKQARELMKEQHIRKQERLTTNQIKFVKRQLEQYEKRVQKINEAKKQIKFRDTNAQERFNQRMNNQYIFEQQVPDSDVEIQQLIDTIQKIKQIEKEQTGRLKQYFDAFLFAMSQSYVAAFAINTGQIQFNSGNTVVEIACGVIKFIPVIGVQLSSISNFVADKFFDINVRNSSAQIAQFKPNPTKFDQLMDDFLAQFIYKNKQKLLASFPDYILNRWQSKLMGPLKSQLNDIKDKVYGTCYGTPMKKLAFKHACALMSQYIGTGKVYENKDTSQIDRLKQSKLVNYAQVILDKDLREEEEEQINADQGNQSNPDSNPNPNPDNNNGNNQAGQSTCDIM